MNKKSWIRDKIVPNFSNLTRRQKTFDKKLPVYEG